MNLPKKYSIAFALLNLLLVTTAARAADEPTAAEKHTRQLLDLKIAFAQYVFSGDEFPAFAFAQPAQAKELIGAYTITARFYDHDFKIAVSAERSGLYGAELFVQPEHGPAYHRYVTLYRTPAPLAPDLSFTPETSVKFARAVGIAPEILALQATLAADVLKTHTSAEFQKDPKAARLLAGLSLSKPTKTIRKNEDAFAQERQWWVTLKRQLNGTAKLFPKAVNAPDIVEGMSAPVVREGTLAEAGMKPDSAEKIDAALATWAADDDQAFAVCVVRKGVIVLHKAYGIRAGKPMTVTTKSWMASITKPMSTSCMMMLLDRGLVSLDEPLDHYLPALKGIKVEKPLTIRHLYTHTAGLSKWPNELYNDELPDIEERIALAYPHLHVGKEWAYNGQSYTLGGKIIETVSSEALPLFFQKHLLEPLGCTNTDVVGTHADAQSVPLDIAKFGQMLLNKGSYGRFRFFKTETFEQMLPRKLTTVLGPEATKIFGLGLDGSPEKFGHGAASAATFHIDTTEDLVVVMTRNKMGKNQEKYNGKFWDAIRNGIDKPVKK